MNIENKICDIIIKELEMQRRLEALKLDCLKQYDYTPHAAF